LNKIVFLVGSIEVKKVLDIGCGEGFVINKLLSSYPHFKIIGLDINADVLCFAKHLNPRVEFIEGDINNFPLKKKSFDLVMAIEVLEHMRRPMEVLERVKEITTKYALFSVPNEPFFRISNFIRFKNFSHFGNDPEHLQNWTKVQFLKLLKSNGFTILKVTTPFPWIIVLAEIGTIAHHDASN